MNLTSGSDSCTISSAAMGAKKSVAFRFLTRDVFSTSYLLQSFKQKYSLLSDVSHLTSTLIPSSFIFKIFARCSHLVPWLDTMTLSPILNCDRLFDFFSPCQCHFPVWCNVADAIHFPLHPLFVSNDIHYLSRSHVKSSLSVIVHRSWSGVYHRPKDREWSRGIVLRVH